MKKIAWRKFASSLLVGSVIIGSVWNAIETRARATESFLYVTPPLPTVSILSSTSSLDGGLSLEVEVVADDNGTPELELLIDRKVISEVTVTRARDLVRPSRFLMTAQLPHRDCVVSVVVRSHAGASVPASARMRWTAQGAIAEVRPAMYVLAVGVGRYHDPEIAQLAFPNKDARDLVAALSNQRNSVYRSVEAQLRLDQEATRENILNGLRWLREHVQPGDMAVVFLAGHGMNDLAGNYYYLPHEASINTDTMLSGAELQAALKPVAGRVLLLLDTCHSGGALGRSSLTRLINELTAENKIVVFTASTGAEAARESPTWKNGAFTKALVEGLRGVADYEENGLLSLSELETWVGVRVRALTQGTQTPTVAKPNAIPDYIVSALPKAGVLPTLRQMQRRRLLGGLLGGGAGAIMLIGILSARPWELSRRPTADLIFH